jgi:hypothetical protein
MHMLLLTGVSVGFVLSVLTSNNFYSEKVFSSSVNQWVCNEMKNNGCTGLIAHVSDQQWAWGGGQWYYGGGSGTSSEQSSQDIIDIVESFFDSIFNAISNFFSRLF